MMRQAGAKPATSGSTRPYRESKRLKALAVTVPQRMSSATDIPTARETRT